MSPVAAFLIIALIWGAACLFRRAALPHLDQPEMQTAGAPPRLRPPGTSSSGAPAPARTPRPRVSSVPESKQTGPAWEQPTLMTEMFEEDDLDG